MSFLKQKSKMTDDFCVFEFPWRSVDGEDLIRFDNENLFCWGITRSTSVK